MLIEVFPANHNHQIMPLVIMKIVNRSPRLVPDSNLCPRRVDLDSSSRLKRLETLHSILHQLRVLFYCRHNNPEVAFQVADHIAYLEAGRSSLVAGVDHIDLDHMVVVANHLEVVATDLPGLHRSA